MPYFRNGDLEEILSLGRSVSVAVSGLNDNLNLAQVLIGKERERERGRGREWRYSFIGEERVNEYSEEQSKSASR